MGLFRKILDQITRAIERIDNPDANNTPAYPPGPTCSSSPSSMINSSSLVCHNPEHISSWNLHELNQYRYLCQNSQCSWIVPFAGNSFLIAGSSQTPVKNCNLVSGQGLVNWTSAEINPCLYFHCGYPGTYVVALRVRVQNNTRSSIRVSAYTCVSLDQCEPPQIQQLDIVGVSPDSYQIISCGNYTVAQPGYVKLELSGIDKSGPFYADVSHAILIPEHCAQDQEHDQGPHRQKRSLSPAEPPEKSSLRFVSDPDDFYFGRRGPSVHLNYVIPPLQQSPRQLEYFYNELLVPPSQDVIGSYFCAIGFSGGYFGIQVNSESERRVLFSIWSEFSTDNPNEIPEHYKVVTTRRGKTTHVGEFGNEGSGGQSYVVYPWKSNTLYKFLVQAKPLDSDNTQFTAWFCDSSQPSNTWMLIASFRKPKVSTYLTGLYSFSENFIPEMGHVERKCLFGNQWAFDNVENCWVEVTRARFSADATAGKGVRRDVAGGVVQTYGWNDGSTDTFFLRNCGFFSDSVDVGQEFSRSACGCVPSVEFCDLP